MTELVTADLHIGHKRLAVGMRGFSSAEEMDDILVRNWNESVKEDDVVYVLGDLTMRKFGHEQVLKQLNGSKVFVRGNHDKHLSDEKLLKYFRKVDTQDSLKIGTDRGVRHIRMYHYPCYTWNGSFHGSWLLCGHTHGMLRESLPTVWTAGLILDVGMDVWGMRPVPMDEIIRVMFWKEDKIAKYGGTQFGDYKRIGWPSGPLEEARAWSSGDRVLE